MPDFEEVRSGAYVCQCPPGGSVAPGERQATSERRDRLIEQLAKAAALNSSHSLDQLSLELDERLADRRFVAERLFPEAAGTNHLADGPTGNRAAPMQSRHFALGAQLESDAALQWLASDLRAMDPSSLSPFEQARFAAGSALEKLDWPEQVCRLCRPQAAIMATEGDPPISGQEAAKTNKSSSLLYSPSASSQADEPFDQSQQLSAAAMLETATTCGELPSGSRNWSRPLVLALQSSCVIIALALIGILFRCRKSRVSSILIV